MIKELESQKIPDKKIYGYHTPKRKSMFKLDHLTNSASLPNHKLAINSYHKSAYKETYGVY
jgi:hypothetical protein